MLSDLKVANQKTRFWNVDARAAVLQHGLNSKTKIDDSSGMRRQWHQRFFLSPFVQRM